MSTQLDFYFDFGSPTTYLAYKRLDQLAEQYDLEINYCPMLLGGVFKATENASPVTIPAKGSYMVEHDLPRFARRYGVPLNFNPHFPINTIMLMRGFIAAREMGVNDQYVAVNLSAMWEQALNMGDPEVAAGVWQSAGLDAMALSEAIQTQPVKDALLHSTKRAAERGAFGVPTFFVGDEMFFGKERIIQIEQMIQQAE